MALKHEFVEGLVRQGFAIVPKVLTPNEVACLISLLDHPDDGKSIRRRGGVYAIRNLLAAAPAIATLAESPVVRALVDPVVGAKAFPVRGILFDKPPIANWKVPWHQDLMIAVKEKKDVPGFGPWSVKAGVPHAQPPVSVLEQMLAVRIHLDDCGESNGALRVIPASHLQGRLNAEQIHQLSATPAVSCAARVGDALLMRPLLLHASSASKSPSHRRVIHLEFACGALPGGLEWHSHP